jgi:hypothetical protein
MSSTFRRVVKLPLIVSLIVILLIGTVMFLPILTGLAQQEQERLIDKETWRNEPIKILKLKTRGKAIELGKKFSEGDDWLRGLTASVENISDKLVSRIELHLSFPRPKGTDSEETPEYLVSMIYGKEPSPDADNQKQVLPGESVDVKLLEANLPFIKTDLKNLGYPEKITHAQIMVNSVTFSDGTMWAGGIILYPDPDNPGQKRNPLLPKPSEPPPSRSALPGNASAPRFQNVSFRYIDAPTILNSIEVPFVKLGLPQSSHTLDCNTVFVTTQHHACTASGCNYDENVFDDSI